MQAINPLFSLFSDFNLICHFYYIIKTFLLQNVLCNDIIGLKQMGKSKDVCCICKTGRMGVV